MIMGATLNNLRHSIKTVIHCRCQNRHQQLDDFKRRSLTRLSYYVNDSYDDTATSKPVFEPAGSDIQKDTVFVINNHCFLGYFDDMKEIPYEVTILHPTGMYGSTATDWIWIKVQIRTDLSPNHTTRSLIIPFYMIYQIQVSSRWVTQAY